MLEDTRLIDCPVCGGNCGFEHLTGYDPRDGSPTGWIEPCDYCHGRGYVLEELEPIEQEDLPT
jgi:hypothetical protein